MKRCFVALSVALAPATATAQAPDDLAGIPQDVEPSEGSGPSDDVDLFGAEVNGSHADIDPFAPTVSTESASESILGDLDLRFSGLLQTETHYRVQKKTQGDFYDLRVLPDGFVRNENTIKFRLNARWGRFGAATDLDMDWIGFSRNFETLGELSELNKVSPLRFDAHALFVEANDLFFDGFNLRVGQQIVNWGVGDQFNPTNNLNPLNLQNVLLFGEQVSNMMVRLDYAFWELWSASVVAVPVFKPAVVPASAPFALGSVERLPFVSGPLRRRLSVERELAKDLGTPTVVSGIDPELPKPGIGNMQWMLRLAGVVADQDIAVSYYNGRYDFPIPVQNVVRQSNEQICNPEVPAECVDGLLTTDVILRYPKMQVIGLNASGQVDLLGWMSDSLAPIGYRLELGVYLPEERRFTILQEDLTVLGVPQPPEYQYNLPGGGRPIVVEDQPFAKWVFGLDYTFGRHLYMNVMWVHGMPDEFGAGDFFHRGYAARAGEIVAGADLFGCIIAQSGDACVSETVKPRIGDYLVIGTDVRLMDQKLLLRFFGILDLNGVTEISFDSAGERQRQKRSPFSADGFSAVIYPEVEYNFGTGFTLGVGALLQVGKEFSKFGDPAAGGSLAWGRARYAW